MPEDINSLKQSVFNKSRKDKFLLVFNLPPILRNLNQDLLDERTVELLKQDSVQYSIWGSPIPEVQIPAKTLKMDGQFYKVTSQTRVPYPAITVNFTVDNRFSNWWVIWKWLDVMNYVKDSGMDEYFANWQEGQDKRGTLDERSKASEMHEALARDPSKNKFEKHKTRYNDQPIHMTNDFLDYQTIMTIYGLDEYNQKIIQFDYHKAFPTLLGGVDYNYRDPGEIESRFQFEFSQMYPKLIGTPY